MTLHTVFIWIHRHTKPAIATKLPQVLTGSFRGYIYIVIYIYIYNSPKVTNCFQSSAFHIYKALKLHGISDIHIDVCWCRELPFGHHFGLKDLLGCRTCTAAWCVLTPSPTGGQFQLSPDCPLNKWMDAGLGVLHSEHCFRLCFSHYTSNHCFCFLT